LFYIFSNESDEKQYLFSLIFFTHHINTFDINRLTMSFIIVHENDGLIELFFLMFKNNTCEVVHVLRAI